MAIPIEDFREPQWVRYLTRYPLSDDRTMRFSTVVAPRHYPQRYNSDDPSTAWKQAGYNPNDNSTRVQHINLTSDDYTLRPY